MKTKVILLLIWATCVDVMWFFGIALYIWDSDAYEKLAGWESNLHWCCFICACINFVIKLIAAILTCIYDDDVNNSYNHYKSQASKIGGRPGTMETA